MTRRHDLILAPPDPLDRIADSIATAKLDKVWVALSYPEADALVEVARAARAAEHALWVTAPKASQPWLRKLVPLKNLRAALARLNKGAIP